ncbi:hypothetical protein PTD2_02016 [Pseudoalteromonas tunicata D2]|jgi:hypothetical protein|uniref:Uncharacterized protein n=2 Tax=Pseudoalteromonas tunicata D2 TaxID=87626 RepID=A4C424_9GAMM|nr:hypothetical protein [Pseudoalteromonas tunicata]EAR28490.1 hypothetical protein PTD2_21782 [Pseudoalteromonas tunicata D2]EAR30306.1 hypothetical protein PTD2_02016 [Pseudoalteromonas tunicata D2]
MGFLAVYVGVLRLFKCKKGFPCLMHPVLQLFYIMNQAIQLPLGIHFRLTTQGQFIHAFIDGDIPPFI